MRRRGQSLDGRVVAVTGGSRGIGRCIADAMLAEGARVAIGARDLEGAQRAAAELGRGALAVALEVTDRASVERFLDVVEEAFGPVELFVNNAGVMCVGSFLEEDEAMSDRHIDVNLNGVINGMRAAVTRMRRGGGGHVINVASAVARIGVPGVATYSAAKHAVLGLSEAVRGELRGEGIEISVVMPIPARTELTTGLPDARLVRWLRPEQIADAVVAVARRPRFEVYVPRWTGGVNRVLSVVPRSVRDASGRFLKADRLLADTQFAARASYETRALSAEHASEHA